MKTDVIILKNHHEYLPIILLFWCNFMFCVESSNEDDQVGKSVAIMVGVLAGLAILVVLLSICRRAFGITL